MPSIFDAPANDRVTAAKEVPTVFLSYSRRDIDFVDRLDADLQARGIKTLVDRAEIEVGELWFKRIKDLISQAETVIFVLSPDSAKSKICADEVDYGKRLGKRFIPVVAHRENLPQIPEALSELNYVYLDIPESYDSQLDRLVHAVKTDLEWVRTHAELGRLAEEWSAERQPRALLLRTTRLRSAEAWAGNRPANAQLPTENTRALITASRGAARRWRNGVFGTLAFGLMLALGLAAFAFKQRATAITQEQMATEQRNVAERERQRASEREQEAQQQRAAAEEQRALALRREAEARVERDRALLSQSRSLTTQSRFALELKHDATTSRSLALEALPTISPKPERPYLPEAEQALYIALQNRAERFATKAHSDSIFATWDLAQYGLVGSASIDDVKLWSDDLQKEVFSLSDNLRGRKWPENAFVAAALSPSGSSIIVSDATGQVSIIDIKTRQVAKTFSTGNRTILSDNYNSKIVVGDALGQSLNHFGGKIQISTAVGQYLGELIFRDSLVITADERFLIKSDEEDHIQYLRIIDLETGALLHELRSPRLFTATSGISIDPNSNMLFWPFSGGGFIVDISHQFKTYVIDLPPPNTPIPLNEQLRALTEASNPSSVSKSDVTANRVMASGFSDHGRKLNVVLADGGMLTFDTSDGKLRSKGRLSDDIVTGALIVPSDDTVLVSMRTQPASVWSISRQVKIGVIPNESANISQWRIDALNHRIYGISQRGLVVVWRYGSLDNTVKPELLNVLGSSDQDGEARSIAFGRSLLSGHKDGRLKIWEGERGLISPGPAYQEASFASQVKYSPDGSQLLFAASGVGVLVSWPVASAGKPKIIQLVGHSSVISQVAFSPGGALVLTASYDQTVKIWDAKSGDLKRTIGVPASGSVETGFTGKLPVARRSLMSAAFDPGARRWAANKSRIELAFFSPSGEQVFIASATGEGLLVNVNTGDQVVLPTELDAFSRLIDKVPVLGSSRWITSAAFTSDESIIAIGRYDGTVHLWDVKQKIFSSFIERGVDDPQESLLGNRAISFLVFSREGRRLIVTGSGNVVRAYDLSDLSNIRSRRFGFKADGTPDSPSSLGEQQEGNITAAVLSPDRIFLVTSSEMDSNSHIWDIDRGEHVGKVFSGPTGSATNNEVNRVRFSRDGRQLFVSYAGLFNIYDTSNWSTEGSLFLGSNVFDFDVYGRTVAVASPEGLRNLTIPLALSELRELAESTISGCLSRSARVYVGLDETPPAWCRLRGKYPYRRSRIGVQVEGTTAATAARLGRPAAGEAFVARTVSNGPARLSGIRAGDIILGVDGQPMPNSADVVRQIAQVELYHKTFLTVWRNRKEITIEVQTVGEE